MELHKDKFGEFVRFCIVGLICTCLDASIFYCFRGFVSYRIALVCGYVISLIVNYFLTVFWTFKRKPTTKNAIGIVAAHLFNLLVVRIGLMYIFVDLLSLNDGVAYIPMLAISTMTNFVIVKFIVDKIG